MILLFGIKLFHGFGEDLRNANDKAISRVNTEGGKQTALMVADDRGAVNRCSGLGDEGIYNAHGGGGELGTGCWLRCIGMLFSK